MLTDAAVVGRLPVHALCDDPSEAGYAHIQGQVAEHGCLDERAS